MKVKPTNPDTAIGLIDPVTKRCPFIDPGTGDPLPEADVPESSFWMRRLAAGEIERVNAPIGNAPIAPLTTRRTPPKEG